MAGLQNGGLGKIAAFFIFLIFKCQTVLELNSKPEGL